MMLGTCQLYKGNHTKAIKSLERSLSIDPRMTTDLMLLGEAYLKSGDLVKANTNLDQALARSPKITSALFYKGICAEKANDTATARKCFENAYTYQKLRLADNGEDYYLMFQICQKLSKDKEAESNKSEAAKLLFTYEAPWKN